MRNNLLFFSAKKPFSRYISVAQLTNPITDIIYFLLGYYIGTWTKYDKGNCTEQRSDVSNFSLGYLFAKPAIYGCDICPLSLQYITGTPVRLPAVYNWDICPLSCWNVQRFVSDPPSKVWSCKNRISSTYRKQRKILSICIASTAFVWLILGIVAPWCSGYALWVRLLHVSQ